MTVPLPRARVAAACLALSALCAPLAAHAAANDLAAVVDGAVKPLLARYGVPGIAVAVTMDGQARFFNYGVASTAAGTPVSERTLFELGSVSKTFTATLACQAQGAAKLAFDDHPGRYLPQLQGSAIDRATLLEFGTYTAAGLPLQVPDDVQDDAQLLAWLRGWQPDAPPGTRRLYSNPSIGMLGRAAAAALHEDFADAVEGRLLPALGLAHTYIRVPQAAQADYAWGTGANGKPRRVGAGLLDAETYGIKSSSADMIRYVQANIAPDRLAPAVARALDCTHVGYFQVGGMVQGLGWEQYPWPVDLPRLLAGNSDTVIHESNPVTRLAPPQAPGGPTLFNKTGSTGGFGAYVAFVPRARIGVVILANRSYPIAARVTAAHAILEQLAHTAANAR